MLRCASGWKTIAADEPQAGDHLRAGAVEYIEVFAGRWNDISLKIIGTLRLLK
jgi:hypothetical protein